jgi:trigger factor
VDGEEFAGGSMTGFELELGGGSFLPGFEEQIIGMKNEENKKINVSLPEDHPNGQLAGKQVEFDLTLKEIREAKPVEIDDKLAEESGLKNLDALKSTVREELGREYGQLSRSHLKRSLLDVLSLKHEFEVPEGILEPEFETIWKQVEEAKERDNLDEVDKSKSEEELKEQYRDIARRRVRLGLLIAEVGRINNIIVSQDDLNKAMHTEAARLPGQEARVLEYFQKTPEAVQQLHGPIFEDKVVDFIFEMANVTEVKTTLEQLSQVPDDSNGGVKKVNTTKSKAKSKSKSPSRSKGKEKK